MPSCLHYRADKLFIEDSSLQAIAKKFGTPCYIYSRSAIEKNWHTFADAFKQIPHHICYAVKANSNIAILNLLAKLNSGFDIVSAGELNRVIAAAGNPKKIIFSGVGKRASELQLAITTGIFCVDIESHAELERIHRIAKKLKTQVNVSLRVNPNINPHTHSHIATGLKENKFGIPINEILPLCQQLTSMRYLRLVGLACHIGSQITSIKPFLLAIDRLLKIYKKLQSQNICIRHINIGGGLGIEYHQEKPPSIHEFARAIQNKFAPYPLEVILEPGRAIVGNAGILLTRVEYLKHSKHKNFAIVDAGMNDFIRPALYDAWQNILPVTKHSASKKTYDIAGPICESADFLGKKRKLSLRVGDLLAIDSAGAYGFSMSSNYNSRGRPAEILVKNTKAKLIRQRETISDLIALEKII